MKTTVIPANHFKAILLATTGNKKGCNHVVQFQKDCVVASNGKILLFYKLPKPWDVDSLLINDNDNRKLQSIEFDGQESIIINYDENYKDIEFVTDKMRTRFAVEITKNINVKSLITPFKEIFGTARSIFSVEDFEILIKISKLVGAESFGVDSVLLNEENIMNQFHLLNEAKANEEFSKNNSFNIFFAPFISSGQVFNISEWLK